MRYLMALMLVWGVCQFSSAQVEQNLDEDCPPTSKNEGQTESNGVEMDTTTDADADVTIDDDAFVRENELEIESDDSDVKIEEEYDSEGQLEEYEYKDDQTEFDIETDESDAGEFEMLPSDSMPMEQDQSKECPDVDDGTTSDADVITTYETTNVVIVEEEKEHSTAGKIIRAPVKFVGNIPKAVVSIGSETLEGAGHIVGAPFKGIGKLFGAGDNDDEMNEDI